MQYLWLFLEIMALVVMAAISSGLNISLMSLRIGDLRRKAKLGNAEAARVLPLREKAYLSLAAILFTNVALISASSLVMAGHFNGWIAGLATTILMVIFSEVLPQALFVRRALYFSALFAPVIRLMIFVTYPISKPLSLLLDHVVGPSIATVYSRAELGLLIAEHKTAKASDLDDDEIEIIRSTLLLSEKSVRDIMRPISAVIWLRRNARLDDKVLDQIRQSGYSRLPVFNNKLTRCFGVLHIKDLMRIEPSERATKLADLDLHRATAVGSRMALDTLFRKFQTSRSQLLPVKQDGHIIGVVTFEDLVEEIIGHEVIDETDYTHNRV